MPLSHFDEEGRAHMVDVGPKPETARVAVASGVIEMRPATLARVRAGKMDKGDVLGVARLAGIQAVKRTAELIPLCHPLRISSVAIDLVPRDRPSRVEVRATVRAFDRTGVEMEALTAVSVALLTVYDMCKAVDRGMRLGDIQLEHKAGGRSGVFSRPAATRRRRR